MTRTLRDALLQSGATVNGATSTPLDFGNAPAELQAALHRCVVADRSARGRLVAQGPDFLGLLQRLSTGDVASLSPGHGRETVLTSNKGRIVERLFVHHLGDEGVLVIGGPGSAPRIAAHFRRFTFAEKIDLTDVTEDTCLLSMFGPMADEALESTGFARPEPYGSLTTTLEGDGLHALGQGGWSSRGYSFLASAEMAGSLWRTLALAVMGVDGRPAGELALEACRILLGIPDNGHELTEDFNPLEAGLDEAISFDKGCYVGQEVVARLRTYDKVASALVGIRLEPGASAPAPGTPLFHDGRSVGSVTSATVPPGYDHPVGLAYVKRRVEPTEDLALGAADSPTTVHQVPLPFPLERT